MPPSRRIRLLWLLAVMVLVAGAFAKQVPAPAPTGPPWPAGPISAAEVEMLLKQFSVPGVSIAVIKDFAIDWARGYGVGSNKPSESTRW